MEMVFIVSSVLLIGLLGVRYYEFAFLKHRMFEMPRMQLDRSARKCINACRKATRNSYEYLHKDIILNGLHMVTYVALLFVRFVEHRLHKVTLFLRSFKKKAKQSGIKNSLQTIHRERTVDENNKNFR